MVAVEPLDGQVYSVFTIKAGLIVERSIAFYGLLGFSVAATFGPPGCLGWASLTSGRPA